VRALAGRLRPITKFENLLDTQNELDVLKREAKVHVKKMVSQSQEMLFDAHLHLANYQRLRKLFRQIQLRGVRAAFDSWAGQCSAEAAEQRLKWQAPAVQSFLKGILLKSGYGAFFAWHEEVTRERKTQQRNAEIHRKLVETEAAMGKVREERIKQILSRIIHQDLSKAFSWWKTWVAKAREENARNAAKNAAGQLQEQLEEQEQQHRAAATRVQQQRLEQCISKWLKKAMVEAWKGWNEVWEESRELKNKLKRAIKKMTHRAIAGAFTRWKVLVGESKETRLKVKRSLGKLLNRAIAGAFDRWRDMTQESKELKLRIHRSLAKLINGVISNAFDNWSGFVADKRGSEAKLRKIALRLTNSALLGAFARWCEISAESKETRFKVKRSLGKLLNRQLAGAFDRWAEMCEELQVQRHAVARIIGMMRKRIVVGAFQRWAEMAQESKDLRAKCTAILSRMRNRLVESYTRRKRERALLLRSIGKLRHGLLAKAYEKWAHRVEEMKRQEQLVRGMIVRMQRRGMAMAFDRWVEAAGELRWQRQTMLEAIHRMRAKELKLAFNAWRDNIVRWRMTEENKAASAEEKAHQRLMRVLGRFLRQDLAKAFTLWFDNVQGLREQRHKLAGCVRRMRLRGLVGAFNTWLDTWEQVAELRRKLQRAVQKLMNAKVSGAFAKWASVTLEAALEKAREAHRLAGAAGRAAALSPALHIVRRRVSDAMARLEQIWEGAFLSKERKAKLSELRERVERLGNLIPTLSDLERAPYVALAGKERAAHMAAAGAGVADREEGSSLLDLFETMLSPEETEAALCAAAAEIESELISLAEAHTQAVKENLEARAAVAAAAADERKRQRTLVGMIRRRIVTHLNDSNDSMRQKLKMLTRHMDNSRWVIAMSKEEMEAVDAEEGVETVRGEDLALADAPDDGGVRG